MLRNLFKKSKKEKNNSTVVKLKTESLNQVVGGGAASVPPSIQGVIVDKHA